MVYPATYSRPMCKLRLCHLIILGYLQQTLAGFTIPRLLMHAMETCGAMLGESREYARQLIARPNHRILLLLILLLRGGSNGSASPTIASQAQWPILARSSAIDFARGRDRISQRTMRSQLYDIYICAFSTPLTRSRVIFGPDITIKIEATAVIRDERVKE